MSRTQDLSQQVLRVLSERRQHYPGGLRKQGDVLIRGCLLLLRLIQCVIFNFFGFRTTLLVSLEQSGVCQFKIGICIGQSFDCDRDEWFLIVLQPNHNGHAPEATSLLRKPARMHHAGDLELVTAAVASYATGGVARSLYYYRTGEVLDFSMIHRLKYITRNSTMARGSAAHELITELRLFMSILIFQLLCFHFLHFVSCGIVIEGQTHSSILSQYTTPIRKSPIH
jgi:hypothetical protein